MPTLIEARSIWRKHARDAAGIRRARCTVCPGTQTYERLTNSLLEAHAAAKKWLGVVHGLEINNWKRGA